MKGKPRPTFCQALALRRIAQTGGMMLTLGNSSTGVREIRYSDRAGNAVDSRAAKALVRNGWVVAERDSMFDLQPQSWKIP